MKIKEKNSIITKIFLFLSKQSRERSIVNWIAIILASLALLPLINLIIEGIRGLNNQSFLSLDAYKQIKGTVSLLFFTSLLGGTIGTANGWLLANCRFSGRKLLRIAQLLPLATPAYLLSATLIDLGSINSIRIYGISWGILIMSLTTYPYVFLLSTESFSIAGKKQLEACRSLGVGPWKSFFRIGLPIAIPSIGAGISLMGMEVLNELGAVQLLNIPTISAGIVENWMSENNPAGAINLALIALIIVFGLIATERLLRRRSRRWTQNESGIESYKWELKGIRAIIAQLLAGVPPLITLGIPIIWVLVNVDQLKKGLDSDIFALTFRSLGIGLTAATLTIIFALFLAIAKRWSKSNLIKFITFLSGVGYAIPGAVLAIALLSFGGPPLGLSPLILLFWGYCDRFLAVAKGGLDAGFERISPSLDEAATGLGSRWPKVLKSIHLPLLKGPISVGILFVFVDTIKELPMTFVLRPFDFDTLSVRIFQYAGDERMAEAILPTIIILILGLIASIAFIPSLDKNKI
tara:strand:- start:7766 stop:9331 length:1566 start_codon:yes stop_codon:yes gene_type:complete